MHAWDNKIGLGTAWLRSEDGGADVVAAAIDRGIRYIDTAPTYGRDGGSESAIGSALWKRTERPVVATKVGPELQTTGDREQVEKSVLRSRERLGVEQLDIVQIHELTRVCWPVVFGRNGVLETLRRLQASGLIQQIGVTCSDAEVLVAALHEYSFDPVLVWKTADLVDDTALQVVGAAVRESKTRMVVGTPLSGGALARSFSGKSATSGYLWRTDENDFRRRLAALLGVARDHQIDLGAIAIQFLTRRPEVSMVIPGASSLHELAQLLVWRSVEIPDKVWEDVETARASWQDDQ
jgi:D-threo-aldose 1-dehydrogenase